MLSGHAHGGQFILPFIGGVISPGEGFNPIYYKRMYAGLEVSASERITRMLVSRGLGNSIIPQRLFNRPEIVVIDLHR
jgi:predicted MPP superfamily phosphohydrolase